MIAFTESDLAARTYGRSPAYELEILLATHYLPSGRMEIDEAIARQIALNHTPTKTIPRPSDATRTTATHARLKRLCDRCPDRHCASVCPTTPHDRWNAAILQRGPGCLWAA